jgi:hypothetical protein
MARVQIGKYAFGMGWLRGAIVGTAGVALAAGLALGVASAQDAIAGGGGALGAGSDPSASTFARPDQNATLGRLGGALTRIRLQPLRPLHQLVLERVTGQGSAAAQTGNVLLGRLADVEPGKATVVTAGGSSRDVLLTSSTKLPRRRPRSGDQVLVLGRGTPDGAYEARVIFVRPRGSGVLGGRGPAPPVRRFA